MANTPTAVTIRHLAVIVTRARVSVFLLYGRLYILTSFQSDGIVNIGVNCVNA